MSQAPLDETGIAIIGMAGRFPGAASVQALWPIVREGRDVVSRFDVADLAADEPDPSVLSQPNYVGARGLLEGADLFDAEFFDYAPAEATHIDPQHRVWLEVAWEALESAGYAHDRHSQIVSVFAGSFGHNYLLHSLLPDRNAVEEYVRARRAAAFALMVQNDSAHLPTRTAHRLNLRGPAVNVQTACSTSLVAVAMAAQNLLAFESDIAIAGGVCIAFPQKTGYFYQEGAILSRDGVCRPYDKLACGTVFGNGAAAIVMKRYADAVRDCDPVLAVIRAAAVNNDGRSKVSYVAPSVQGQAEVIATALGLAGVSAESIGYVEGHGTATPMGDPIEVEALTRAYRAQTARKGYCCLGSLKGNIGHLDAAAGAAGLVRAILALTHRELPPTAHFQEPNPDLRLADSPFFVLRSVEPWPAGPEPRRASVSSFGVGGTNCHVILEEAPAEEQRPTPIDREAECVLELSARDPAALEGATVQLADWLAIHVDDGHVPWTIAAVGSVLRHRRQRFEHRRTLRVRHWADAMAALRNPQRLVTGRALPHGFQTVFLLPGQGSLRSGAVHRLMACHEALRASIEALARPASDLLHFDLWGWLSDEAADESSLSNDNARYQLAIFCIDVALARWLEGHGVTASALLGHSLGELVALHLAGVLSAEHALRAVFERGTLMQSTGTGAALAVSLSEGEVQEFLGNTVHLACVNGPKLMLLSGSPAAIDDCAKRLAEKAIVHRRTPIRIAVHSPCMDAIIEPLTELFRKLDWRVPSLKILSAVTGSWLDPQTATNPEFWARQTRSQVRFDAATQLLAEGGPCLAVEVGFGSTLSSLLRPRFADANRQRTCPLLATPADENDFAQGLSRSLEVLWVAGADVNFHDHVRADVPSHPQLPTYPFQRKRYFIDPPRARSGTSPPSARPANQSPVAASGTEERSSRLEANAHETIEDAEIRIVRLFEKTLGTQGIAATDNFFDRGGNSLLAVVLVSEIGEVFRVSVSLASFFEDPTPRGVHVTIKHAGAASSQTATHVFRKEGDRAPVFFICGIAIYQALAERLRPVHPAFALYVQSEVELLNSLQRGSDVRSSVVALGKEYFERVIAERPHGPYSLVGLSFGGLLALRVAEMLQERGERVELVTLLDTLPPTLMKLTFTQRVWFAANRILREGPAFLVPKLHKPMQARLNLLPATAGEVAPGETASRAARELEDLRECLYSDMGSQYRPSPYPGRVALIISRERDRSSVTAEAMESHWRRLIRGPLVTTRVTGGHVGMLAVPFVDEVAERLQAFLDGYGG
jgi:acyl transferase domain-containing protein/thioesterase domain-containing protein